MSWTPDRVETLKKMWSEGQSASQIANDLGGVTRNAVIGKIHRLGLSNRGNQVQKEKRSIPIDEKAPIRKPKKKSDQNESQWNNSLTEAHEENKKSLEVKINTKETLKAHSNNVNKPIIFTANQPLPPQPSNSEISEETLKNVKSLEKKSKKLSLMELTERTCKWPIGDPATEKFWFCGHTAEPGKPYCETHIEIAFQPIASRRERRSR